MQLRLLIDNSNLTINPLLKKHSYHFLFKNKTSTGQLQGVLKDYKLLVAVILLVKYV